MLIKANKNISFTKEEPFQLSIEKSLKEKINKYWEEFLIRSSNKGVDFDGIKRTIYRRRRAL